MKIEYDPDKRSENLAKHGLDFDDVSLMKWADGFSVPDLRHDYGEDLYNDFIPWQDSLYLVCYTLRGAVIRVISFRRANIRERIYYDDYFRSGR